MPARAETGTMGRVPEVFRKQSRAAPEGYFAWEAAGLPLEPEGGYVESS